MTPADEKLARLRALLRNYGKVAIAFSGGVDSSFLLKVAYEEIPSNVIAIINVTESFSSIEREQAIALAEKIGVPHHIVHTNEMEDECFLANPPDRCYYCKLALFRMINEFAKGMGIEIVLDGTNADDLKTHRPGRKAGMELGIRSPLAEVGLTKDEIRILSRKMGLETSDKPQMSCLASRIPYGERITRKKLDMVEKSESFLRTLGIHQSRVRNHSGVARIEILPKDFPIMISKRTEIIAFLKAQGFSYVTLDLQGFRSGSMDEVLNSDPTD